jgi:hypothetical protein
MKIEKRGLIYFPDGETWWKKLYAMMPTPVFLSEKNCIRVYFGITDAGRNGRVTFIDLDCNNPSVIVSKPENIVLDIGNIGTFDDSGVIPSSILFDNDNVKLYYVGFQRSSKVPYMLYSGLATALDYDSVFCRHSKVPIMDRSPQNPYSTAAPFVIKEKELYKMWFWEGESWVEINGKKYIKAILSYAESINGENWDIVKRGCIKPLKENEFSVGRPWVINHQGIYKMFYSVRYVDKLYRIGYAESTNGIDWIRKDVVHNLDVSESGWDSEMICYPSLLEVNNKTYIFYNGNNNGESGFGYAEIMKW